MNKSVWVAALALGLAGSSAKLVAQSAVWRKANRPMPTKTRAVSSSSPSAMLGKPVPITRGISPEPRRFPDAYRAEPMPVPQRPVYGGIEPIATIPPPGAVIAASAPAQASSSNVVRPEELEEFGPIGDLFAMDRSTTQPVQYAPPTTPPLPEPVSQLPTTPKLVANEGSKLGNWISTFPTLAPKPLESPMMPEPASSLFPCEPVYGEELPPTKWYVRGEYLLWWMKDDRVPPLVTTTSEPNPPAPFVPGAIDAPGTIELFGGTLERNPFSGGRFTFGYYVDDCGEKAIEISGFFLGERSDNFTADSFSNPVLARPFLRVNDGTQDVEFVSFPGAASGKVVVSSPSQMWGIEPNFLCKWCCGCNYRVDLLAGFRYVNLDESLTIEENVIFEQDMTMQNGMLAPVAGTRFFVKDRFAVSNNFYGGQIGIEGRWQRERLTLDARLKIAMGVTQQQLDVEGLTTVNGMAPVTGGLLALESNVGSFSRDRFSVMPEATFTVGYYLTERFRALVGYNFLYWSDVVRPGGQIDTAIDVTQVPSFDNGGFAPVDPPRPARIFKSTDFWVQGINFGFEYRY